jgi:hypothetical protein
MKMLVCRGEKIEVSTGKETKLEQSRSNGTKVSAGKKIVTFIEGFCCGSWSSCRGGSDRQGPGYG